MNARRRVLVALAATLLATASGTTACKKSGDDDKPAARAETPLTGPQRGGHLKLPSNEPRYLNPVIETRADRANMLIFEGLVGLDPTLEPVPRLAESWERSPDGKVLTFRLRKNVKWHDGQPFTARDVAFTFQAIRNASAPSLWKAYMNIVESLETPDDHTVVVTYSEPYAPALVTWTMGIVPKHVYGDTPDITQSKGNRAPIGTGPYKLSRWEIGQRIVLQVNDSWWYRRPHIDTIELLVGTADESAVDLLATGKLDFVRIDDINEWGTKAQLPEFRARFEASDLAESRFRLLAWNVQRPLLADKRVRQALTHALNRGRLIDDVMQGQARPLSAPFFPNMYGADPSIAPRPFDLPAAARLLDEAGHPVKNGERFALEVISLESQRGPVTDATLAIFRNDLRAIGIDFEMDFLPPREFFERLGERDFDAAYFGWLPDIPDPDPYALLHSSQIGEGSNYAGLSSPAVDALLEEARTTMDKEERKAVYQKLHRVLYDEVPYTMLYAPFGHYAWSRRLRGVNPNDIGAQPRFPGLASWWIAPPGSGNQPPRAAKSL